jgi:hypothetical protein
LMLIFTMGVEFANFCSYKSSTLHAQNLLRLW